MTESTSYTTEEIAALLRVSKLTVYDLIKKGELPAYRVGRQMRVDASDLEAYKRRATAGKAAYPERSVQADAPVPVPASNYASRQAERSIVITGQDASLDVLARAIERGVPGIRALRSYAGSLDSLVALYRGEADIVSTHLLDGDTGEYNLPYVKRLFVGQPVIVVRLLGRRAGFFVPAGNPLGLHHWRDLARKGVRIANRERGAGARVLLDEQLRLAGIAAASLRGCDTAYTSHMAVAAAVASGAADVGVGIEQAAAMASGVDFVPLITESVDLVMVKHDGRPAWMDAVLETLRSEAFRGALQPYGYDLSQLGTILLET